MRAKKLLLPFAFIAILISSCEKAFETDTLTIDVAIDETASTRTALIDSLKLGDIMPLAETEELKELKERAKDINKTKMESQSSYYNDYYVLSDNLWALRDYNFSILTKDNNGGKRYLTTDGKGKELVFTAKSSSLSQSFKFKILPATSGIPYLIYSSIEDVPIAVGSYTSTPNKYILMTKSNDTGSLFGASWDLKIASSGGVIIENQDLIGQGSSGNWWDIFNYVAELGTNDKTSLGKYSQSIKQEFEIEPSVTFKVTDVKYVNQSSAKATRRSNLPVSKAYVNDKQTMVGYDMFFDKNVEESSNFKERKSISFKLSQDGTKFKRPEVSNGNVFLTPSVNSEALSTYTTSQKINRTLNAKLPLNVPKRTRIDITYYYAVYDVEVDFEATAVYKDRRGTTEVKLVGRWYGTIHVDELADEHTVKHTNLDTGQITSVGLNLTNRDKNNRINLE